MPINPDAIVLRKLALVKQLYQQALIQSTSQHNFVGTILAVIGFDLAVETLLKTIITTLDAGKKSKDEYRFPEYLAKADELMANNGLGALPDQRNITHVHGIRNDAQHRAKYPNQTDVSDCRTYSRDFLQKTIVAVWGIAFESISLTDLVENDKAKQFLVNAEKALAANEYRTAAEQAIAALTWVTQRVEKSIVGESENDKAFGEFLVKRHLNTVETSNKAYRAFWKMQEVVLIVTLGLDYASCVEYEEKVADLSLGARFFKGREEPVFTYHERTSRKEADASDAEFLIAYTTETIVQIENKVGNIDNPFGRKVRSLT